MSFFVVCVYVLFSLLMVDLLFAVVLCVMPCLLSCVRVWLAFVISSFVFESSLLSFVQRARCVLYVLFVLRHACVLY